MSRITTTVFVMLILMNGAVTAMSASGLNDDLGVILAPGVDSAVTTAIDNLERGFRPQASFGETLFTLFIAALDVMNIIINAVVAVPQMFLNLGFPEWVVVPVFAPMYALSTLELVYAATGRDLV